MASFACPERTFLIRPERSDIIEEFDSSDAEGDIEYEPKIFDTTLTNPYYIYKDLPIIKIILDEVAQQKKKNMWFMMIVMVFWVCVASSHTLFSFLPGTYCYSESLMGTISIGVLAYIVATYSILFLLELSLFLKARNNREKFDLTGQEEQIVSGPNKHITLNILSKTRDHRILVDLVAMGYRINDLKVRRASILLNLSSAKVTKSLKSKEHIERNTAKHQIMEAAKEIQSLSTDTVKTISSQKLNAEPSNKCFRSVRKQLQLKNINNYIKLWLSIIIFAVIFLIILNIFRITNYTKEQNAIMHMLHMTLKNKSTISGDYKYEPNWNDWCNIWYQSHINVINVVILYLFLIIVRQIITI